MSGGIGLALGTIVGVAIYRMTMGGGHERLGKGILVSAPFAGLFTGWAVGNLLGA